jgi:tRNA threonylcarbamoyladenosine biosynthesis protein TsaB
MIRALAIDTVTEMCSVALQFDGEIIERQALAANQHSEIVLGMVDEVLAEAGVALGQLDLIINDVGPGSFTGIRIGLGVTQGLAYGVDIPVLAVDSLSSLAFGVKDKAENMILAAIDARMGQVYWGLFKIAEQSVLLQGTLQLSKPEDMGSITQPIVTVGNAWDIYVKILSQQFMVNVQAKNNFPLARNCLLFGLQASSRTWTSPGELLPVYLRNQVAVISNKHVQNFNKARRL